MTSLRVDGPLGSGFGTSRAMRGSKISARSRGSSGGTRTRPSRQPARRVEQARQEEPPSDQLSQEYIYNLQQQIYFLELDLKLERDNRAAAVEAQGTQLSSDVVIQAAPLEEHMKQLKIKYVDMQKIHDAEIKDMKKQLDDAGEKLSVERFTNIRLNTEITMLKSQINEKEDEHEAALAEWLDTKVDLTKRLELKQSELEDEQADFARLTQEREQLMSDFSKTKLELQQTSDKLKEAKDNEEIAVKRYEGLLRDTEAVRARIIELEEHRKEYDARIRAEKEENKKMSDERWEAQQKAKSLELKYDQATHALTKAEEDCQKLSEENIALQTKVSDLLRDNSSLRLDLTQRDKTRDENKTQRILFGNQVKELEEKIGDLTKTLGERDNAVERLQHELERAQNENEVRDAEVAKLRVQLEHEKDRYRAQDEANTSLRHAKAMLEADKSALERDLDKDDQRLQEQGDKMVQMEVDLDKLRLLSRISEDIAALKVGEFEQMMTSNFQVANNLHCLLEDFERLQSITQRRDSGSDGSDMM